MKHIYLDTSVIVRNPDILGLGTKKQPLLIHTSVYIEIEFVENRGSIKRGLIKLINEAQKSGILKITGPALAPIREPGVRKFQNADNYLYSELGNLHEKGISCILVTEDRGLEAYVKSLGVEVQSGSEFIEKNTKNQNLDIAFSELVTTYRNQRRKTFLIGLVFGILSAVTVISIALNFSKILELLKSIFPILSVLLAPILAFAMFLFRHYARIMYGIVEIIIGILFVIACIYPEKEPSSNITTTVLTYAAAIYVMVRGLDNIDKKIRVYPVIGKIWEYIFR